VDRRWLPLAVAGYAALAAGLAQRIYQRPQIDFPVFWTAGRAVLRGTDPYAAVAAMHTGYPFYYPYPGALIMAPVAALPMPVAWVVWAALVGGLLGLAALREDRLVPACLSAPFLAAVVQGQWSPLLVAGAVLPWLGPVLSAKPSIGAALWFWRPSAWSLVGGLGLAGIGLVLLPGWPLEWWQSIQATNHVPLVFRRGGVLLLFAWLRWRTPEGRMLGLLALIPQTTVIYEALPLWLCCRSRREGYILALLSFVAAGVQELTISGSTVEARAASGWPALFVCLYLPALALILRPPQAEQKPAHNPSGI
jgi:hypothetical protein